MKRTLSLILAALLLASVCASCGSDAQDPQVTDGTQGGDTSENSTETTADQFVDNLPDVKYDGRTITFGVSEASEADILADEINGDITNDALYNRNAKIEERFDVKIETVNISTDVYSFYNDLAKSVLAGDNICDVAGSYAYQTYQAVQQGIYQDLSTFKYLDLSKPWWTKGINDSATINGKLYAVTGYLGMSLMENTYAMFFNNRYLENYGYSASDLYSKVYDGTWTFDELSNIVKDMYEDLNGNGERDDDDFYGYATMSVNALDIWQAAFDMPISSRDGSGKITLDIVTDKRVSAIEKLNQFYYNNTGVRYLTNPTNTTSWAWYEQYNFSAGRQAFVPSMFGAAYSLYRDMSDSYGIVPLPKYDASQKDYLTNINDRYPIWGVPVTVEDTDFVGTIMEALACETRKSVYPVFYDVALKSKFSSDEDTANMVDIVSAGAQFDVAYMFGQYLEGAPYMFRTLIQANSTNLSSTYAEKQAKIEEGLGVIYSYYE